MGPVSNSYELNCLWWLNPDKSQKSYKLNAGKASIVFYNKIAALKISEEDFSIKNNYYL
jgi:hypothetical protein